MEKVPRKNSSEDRLEIKNYNEVKFEVQRISNFISPHLSEPYTIYTYYYFLNHYPELCTFLVDKQNNMQGVLIGRTEPIGKKSEQKNQESSTKKERKKAYIAMIVIHPDYRRKGYAREMIQRFIHDVCLYIFFADL